MNERGMNKKEILREQKKEARRRQVRRQYMILGGGFLAVLLLIVGITAAIKGKNDAEKTAKTGEKKAAEQEETPVSTPIPTPAPVTITVSAAGDCTLGTDVNFVPSTSFDAMYDSVGDPAYFFKNVADVFGKDDLTIVNLEGTLTTGGSRADKTFAFRGRPEYTEILTTGNVEAANLANNHSKDYGEQSYQDTIQNVENAGISTFGYDRTALMDIKGVKVGLVGTYVLAEGLEIQDQMKENIAALKNQGAQLIIVSFHWGAEKANYPDVTQKTLAHMAIDEGAHLVLGHHPHVLQGIEEYKGRNIVYSLGNFCFGGNKNPSDKDTMIFQQTFTIQGDTVQADNVKNIIPCSISSESGYNNYQPKILEGDEAARVMGRIEEYSGGLGE